MAERPWWLKLRCGRDGHSTINAVGGSRHYFTSPHPLALLRAPRAATPPPRRRAEWLRCADSLDHFVGAGEQRRRDGEAEHLGSGQVDDKLESGRLLDRNIAGLRTAQNLVNQLGGAPELIQEVWAVGHETARFNKTAGIEDRRQSRAERKRHDASNRPQRKVHPLVA